MLDVFFDKWWRLGGVSGILFLVLFIVGAAVQGCFPDFDEPIDEVRDWYTDNGEQFLVGSYLIVLAFILFFLPFLSSLRGLLAAAEGGQAVWSRVAFAAGLAFLAVGAVTATFCSVLAFHFGVVKDGDLDEGTIRSLMYLDYITPIVMLLAPLLLASSIVIVRTGVFWRWLAIPGVIAAVLAVISGLKTLEAEPYGGITGIGDIAFPLTALWILLASINMILKREAPAAA
jgi:magnesium-transporting ATPase (P-type)